MKDECIKLREKFIGLKHKLKSDKKALKKTSIKLSQLNSDRDYWIMARNFFIEIAKSTQLDIAKYLEDTVSLTMGIIPSREPLRLVAQFETRRNQQELDLYLKEGENEPIPLLNRIDTVGGSVEEIIAFASRLCIWSINTPRPAPFQAHDEPFGTLQKENILTAARVMKELQEELGLQMLIITHESEIANTADRVFQFKKKMGETVVEEMK